MKNMLQPDYIHIQNAYIATTRQNSLENTHTLIIETDLELPVTGNLSHDPQMDTLLTEIHDMKQRYPSLFKAVDNVEIREKPTAGHIRLEEDQIAFVNMATSPFHVPFEVIEATQSVAP